LLRMVNGFFNSRYSELRNVEFTEFRVDFDDGSILRVEKSLEKNSENQPETQLIFHFKKPGLNRRQHFSPSLFRESRNLFKSSSLNIIESYVPNLKRIAARTWLYLPTNEQLSLEDVFQRFPDYLPIDPTEVKQEEEWLLKLKNSLKIRFIEVQRLLSFSDIRNSEFGNRPVSLIASVATYSQELAKNIQTKLSEYGTLCQSIDRTFPARVVNQKVASNLTEETLRNKLSEIEKKRFRLIEAGLLDKDEEHDFQVEKEIDDRTKSILSVYIEDVEKKLMIFQEIANKIELFKRLINTRFRYKKMTVRKDKGFTFTTPDGNPLSPTNLSSGEQHELVLFYELLFKVQPNSLILIDEPEVSLHVAWQVEFLKDLQEIIKLANFDVLVATHSPDIINDRWDLTVELQGPIE